MVVLQRGRNTNNKPTYRPLRWIYVIVIGFAIIAIYEESKILFDTIIHTTSTTSSVFNYRLLNDLMGLHRFNCADNVWESLLEEVRLDQTSNKRKKVAMEVGMYNAQQALVAINSGLALYGVEPSPKNYERVINQLRNTNHAFSNNDSTIHLYNMAAAAKSFEDLEFNMSGGTGDHVGKFDVWNMKEGENEQLKNTHKEMKLTKIKSLNLDDLILSRERIIPTHSFANNEPPAVDQIYLLKIDTQGYEPFVFSGLTDTLKKRKVDFILFEYWPKGMDLITGNLSNKADHCNNSVKILNQLVEAGYDLYATCALWHPKAKVDRADIQAAILNSTDVNERFRIPRRPLDNLKKNCMWYYSVEDLYPDPDYSMGYWSDILAVNPDTASSSLPENPTTKIGQMLKSRYTR